jgi:hypothetical protein
MEACRGLLLVMQDAFVTCFSFRHTLASAEIMNKNSREILLLRVRVSTKNRSLTCS